MGKWVAYKDKLIVVRNDKVKKKDNNEFFKTLEVKNDIGYIRFGETDTLKPGTKVIFGTQREAIRLENGEEAFVMTEENIAMLFEEEQNIPEEIDYVPADIPDGEPR